MENNKAQLVGTICSPFEHSHNVFGEDFYQAFISILRTSNTADILPIIVSARIVDVKQDMTSFRVEVTGSLRSYNNHNDNGKNSLKLYVWVNEIRETDKFDLNKIEFTGYLCRTPTYRLTPLGREIIDLLLGVNRPYGKSDYLPAIAWGRNALYLSNFKTGEQVVASGRFQCRQYIKVINGIPQEHITYEVSISKLFDGGSDYEFNDGSKTGKSETEILR